MTADTDSPHATTVLGVRHNGHIALGSDGQATMNETVVKHKAEKVRTLYDGEILAGFAGSTADAFTLFERFEEKLQEYGGNVARAAVELAKEWRTDKYLRRLEALLAVASPRELLLISGAATSLSPTTTSSQLGPGVRLPLPRAVPFSRTQRGFLLVTSSKMASQSPRIFASIRIIIEPFATSRPSRINRQGINRQDHLFCVLGALLTNDRP